MLKYEIMINLMEIHDRAADCLLKSQKKIFQEKNFENVFKTLQ